MEPIKILTYFTVFFCAFTMTVKAQNTANYVKYSFEDFLKLKTTNVDEYVLTIYKNVRYPYAQNSDEQSVFNEVLKVSIIHNSSKDIKISTTKKIDNFESDLQRAFKKSNMLFLKEDETKYIVEIQIQIDFAPHDTFNRFDYSKIHILGYEKKY